MNFQVLLLAFHFSTIWGKVFNCDTGIQGQICRNASDLDDFLSAPTPYPAKVNITVSVIDIIALNEEEQSVTVQLNLIFKWTDRRLGVNKTPYQVKK